MKATIGRIVAYAIALLPTTVLVQGGDIGTNAVNLVGFESCSPTQIKTIGSAWEDAVKLGQAIRDTPVDWNSAVAIDYLGPPGFNLPLQGQLQKVLESPADFSQGSRFWIPSPLKWTFYVRCDDWLGHCRNLGRAAAYTDNYKDVPGGQKPKNGEDRKNAKVTVMNFCNKFFEYPSLSDIIAKVDPTKDEEFISMDYYRANTAYVIYHEMMHSDRITWKNNGKTHVWDMRFRLEGDVESKEIYGPLMCKILARWDDGKARSGDMARAISKNADSYAMYALTRAVQDRIGIYPHLPVAQTKNVDQPPLHGHSLLSIVDDENGQLSWNKNVSSFIFAPEAMPEGTCPPDDDTCTNERVELNVNSFNSVPDSDLPAAYVAQRKQWYQTDKTLTVSAVASPTPAPHTDADASLFCEHSAVFEAHDASVELNTAQNAMAVACAVFNGNTMDGTKQPQLVLPQPVIKMDGVWSNNTVWMGAQWNTGDPFCGGSRQVTEDECKQMIGTVLGSCDVDDHFKYGGWKENNCVVWRMGIEGPPRVRLPASAASQDQNGKPFSCTLNPESTDQCGCNDGKIYSLDASGGCGYTSPPWINY